MLTKCNELRTFHRMVTLPAYLREHKVRIKAFADAVGVSRNTVHRWLRGENRPRWKQIERIAEFTNGKVTAESFREAA